MVRHRRKVYRRRSQHTPVACQASLTLKNENSKRLSYLDYSASRRQRWSFCSLPPLELPPSADLKILGGVMNLQCQNYSHSRHSRALNFRRRSHPSDLGIKFYFRSRQSYLSERPAIRISAAWETDHKASHHITYSIHLQPWSSLLHPKTGFICDLVSA